MAIYAQVTAEWPDSDDKTLLGSKKAEHAEHALFTSWLVARQLFLVCKYSKNQNIWIRGHTSTQWIGSNCRTICAEKLFFYWKAVNLSLWIARENNMLVIKNDKFCRIKKRHLFDRTYLLNKQSLSQLRFAWQTEGDWRNSMVVTLRILTALITRAQ